MRVDGSIADNGPELGAMPTASRTPCTCGLDRGTGGQRRRGRHQPVLGRRRHGRRRRGRGRRRHGATSSRNGPTSRGATRRPERQHGDLPGRAGAVTIDGLFDFKGMQFRSDGYRLEEGSLHAEGSAARAAGAAAGRSAGARSTRAPPPPSTWASRAWAASSRPAPARWCSRPQRLQRRHRGRRGRRARPRQHAEPRLAPRRAPRRHARPAGHLDQTVAGLTVAGTVSLVGTEPGTRLTVRGPYVGQDGTLRLGTRLGDSGSLSDRLVIDGGGREETRALEGRHRERHRDRPAAPMPPPASRAAPGADRANLGGLGARPPATASRGRARPTAPPPPRRPRATPARSQAATSTRVPSEYRLHAADAQGLGENRYLRSSVGGTPPLPPPPLRPRAAFVRRRHRGLPAHLADAAAGPRAGRAPGLPRRCRCSPRCRAAARERPDDAARTCISAAARRRPPATVRPCAAPGAVIVADPTLAQRARSIRAARCT